jgi:hypothetical protein
MHDEKLSKDLKSFEKSLEYELNRFGIDNHYNTPDFILARYLMSCLTAFAIAQNDNATWHTKK